MGRGGDSLQYFLGHDALRRSLFAKIVPPTHRRPALTARQNGWMAMWARDSSVVLVSQTSALVVTSLLTILVARELGPSGFGVLVGLLGVAQFLTVVVDAGIATYVL